MVVVVPGAPSTSTLRVPFAHSNRTVAWPATSDVVTGVAPRAVSPRKTCAGAGDVSVSVPVGSFAYSIRSPGGSAIVVDNPRRRSRATTRNGPASAAGRAMSMSPTPKSFPSGVSHSTSFGPRNPIAPDAIGASTCAGAVVAVVVATGVVVVVVAAVVVVVVVAIVVGAIGGGGGVGGGFVDVIGNAK